MSAQIILNREGPTSLRLFVGVITRFAPPRGDLECGIAVILAEDHHTASMYAAVKYPDYDLQALTCLTDFTWILQVILDDFCPEIEALRHFVIQDVEPHPADGESDVYRR